MLADPYTRSGLDSTHGGWFVAALFYQGMQNLKQDWQFN